jgi:tyrosine-protein kinase Etk/Wzc
MNEEFENNEIQSTFDVKGLLVKLLSYWPLFLIALAITFGIAYYINIRMVPVYKIGNMISIKDDQNPFFTTNTSLTFNWGGTTDKINTAVITLRSRSHNEKVVERLQYYLHYKIDGEYQQRNAYKRTPFFVQVDTAQSQILNQQFKVVFKDSVTFDLSTTFEEGGNRPHQFYNHNKQRTNRFVEAREFSREYKIGEKISLPFFSGTFVPNEEFGGARGRSYYISFANFDGTVKGFSRINVFPESKGSSV